MLQGDEEEVSDEAMELWMQTMLLRSMLVRPKEIGHLRELARSNNCVPKYQRGARMDCSPHLVSLAFCLFLLFWFSGFHFLLHIKEPNFAFCL